MHHSRGENIFNIVNIFFMVLFSIICVYPFIYILAISFNDGFDAMRGGIYFFPRQFTIQNYLTVFRNDNMLSATMVSVYRTVTGTILTVLGCATFAFALTKNDLPGRRWINWLIIVPMYFGAGLIPTFMVYRGLGLVDTLLVYIIPYIYVPFRILLLRTYYNGMDIALEESAMIDGANYFTIFFRIFFPLSAPALATIALLTGVHHWNDWFIGTVYVYSADKWPLQTLLLSILHGAEIGNQMMEQGTYMGPVKNIQITVESIKMAMLMITVVPIVAIYPFLQRYFVSGLMIGSLKG
jgi:putative aldouronate transport system permease protein